MLRARPLAGHDHRATARSPLHAQGIYFHPEPHFSVCHVMCFLQQDEPVPVPIPLNTIPDLIVPSHIIVPRCSGESSSDLSSLMMKWHVTCRIVVTRDSNGRDKKIEQSKGWQRYWRSIDKNFDWFLSPPRHWYFVGNKYFICFVFSRRLGIMARRVLYDTCYEENKKTKSHKFADKMGLDLTCFQVLRNSRGKEMLVRVIEARPLFSEN